MEGSSGELRRAILVRLARRGMRLPLDPGAGRGTGGLLAKPCPLAISPSSPACPRYSISHSLLGVRESCWSAFSYKKGISLPVHKMLTLEDAA